MERFCGPEGFSVFAGNATSEDGLDFGPCFENVVVVALLPAVFALLALFYRINSAKNAHKSREKAREYGTSGRDWEGENSPLLGSVRENAHYVENGDSKASKKTYTVGEDKHATLRKLHGVATVCAMAVCVCTCVWQAVDAACADLPLSAVVAGGVTAGCWLLIAVLSLVDLKSARPPSTQAFLFAFFSLLTAVVRCRSVVLFQSLSQTSQTIALVQLISYAVAFFFTAAWPALPFIHDEKGQTVEPVGRVCPLELISFGYITYMLRQVYKKGLQYEDIWQLLPKERTAVISEYFTNRYLGLHEELRKHPNLLWKLIRMEWVLILLTLIFSALGSLCQLTGPIILKEVVGYFQGTSHLSPWMLGFYTSGLFFSPVLASFFFHWGMLCGVRAGMRWRSVLVSVIYQKALRLSTASRQQSTVGQMTNLLSVDAERIRDFAYDMQEIFVCPMSIGVAIAMLFHVIGSASLAGIAVMVATMPINGAMAAIFGTTQMKFMEQSDKRVGIMSEILKGMRVIKFFAWEASFVSKVTAIREEELRQGMRYAIANSIQYFMWLATPIMVTVATFFWYSQVQGHELDAVKVFATLATFNILRMALMTMPHVVMQIVNLVTSTRRLTSFLTRPDIDTDRNRPASNRTGGNPIIMQQASVEWEEGKGPVLRDITCRIQPGKLVCVVGATGGGKSAFVHSVLGELALEGGLVGVSGRLAYVSQQPWIQAGSIRDNILFGRPYNAQRYEAVIRACCLVRDLQLLAQGDATMIGEKGTTLSGGQKQRVNLARAVYGQPELILLDDPLSAVDAHVAKHIFTHCILDLLQGTTRVLVTHALSLALPHADTVMVVADNTVKEQGTFAEVMAQRGLLYDMMQHSGHTENGNEKTGKSEENTEDQEEEGVDNVHFTDEDVRDALQRGHGVGTKLIEDEDQETGRVSLDVYKLYYKAAGGYSFFAVAMFLYTVGQGIQMLTDYWTAWWSVDRFGWHDSQRYITWYAILGLIGGVLILIRSFVVSYGGILASLDLHRRLLENLIRAPMRFFETTPVGRILNRFSKDMQSIDTTIMPLMGDLYYGIFTCLGSVIVISTTTPWFLVIVAPVTYLYYYVTTYYQTCARELKRFDSTTRSPIYTHFSESVDGAVTIRAYRDVDRFVSEMYEKVDGNSRPYWMWITSNRWLAVRLETLSALMVLVAAVLALLVKDKIDAGIAGLSLTYALELTGTINWVVRVQADVEMAMNSVERVKEYSEIPQEAPEINPDNRPPSDWPKKGKVEIRNLNFHYAPGLPAVLKGLSLNMEAGQRIGIVGRTGAGKSSLLLALFRLAEISEGTIFIDGIDITKLGLGDLRRGLGIIPQEPVLFTGTVRSNLDPFNLHDDDQLWGALRATNMADPVANMEGKLDASVAENGENFSVGQRQLLCLARAVLQRPRVLVLDEATASVDFATDAAIQKTIRTQFKNTTIIAVAHRLQTVIDYDRVAVIDSGRVAEFGDPLTLIQKQGGAFQSMCRDSGHFDSLLQCAQSRDPEELLALISQSAGSGQATEPESQIRKRVKSIVEVAHDEAFGGARLSSSPNLSRSPH
eukprot:comp24299_c0_seq1/m.45570 comp24299_c0_seq1/g.45570  ORF comp24299_c0_seq1/g.45570 comp24299_c0_seq1/m.45570 type:complete len:1564 (-) comp24299_c0_seq1:469-5160(-)